MNTDPIADLLTRIRNAILARHPKTTVPNSSLKRSILEVMKKTQFITDYKVVKDGKFEIIEIQFNLDRKTISLKRISKPGQRIYVKRKEVKPVLNGYGISILSTPKGVMTGTEAIKAGLGGEYLCQLW